MKVRCFPQKSEIRQKEYLILGTCSQHCLKLYPGMSRQREKVKKTILRVKLSILTGDMILYVENANKSTEKVLEQINESARL